MRFPDGPHTLTDAVTGMSMTLTVNGNTATSAQGTFHYYPALDIYVCDQVDITIKCDSQNPSAFHGTTGTPPGPYHTYAGTWT